MITPLEVYGIFMLDTIWIILLILGLILFFIGLCFLTVNCEHNPKCKDICKDLRAGFKLCCLALIFPLIGIFIPSSKQMAAIIIIPKLVNSQITQKAVNDVPDRLMKIFDKWADDQFGGDKG